MDKVSFIKNRARAYANWDIWAYSETQLSRKQYIQMGVRDWEDEQEMLTRTNGAIVSTPKMDHQFELETA